MLAVRSTPNGLRLREVEPPAADGVRVLVTHVGICGSDVDVVSRGSDTEVTLGHEIAGVLSDGRGVAIEPLLPCGACPPCVAGEYNLCVHDRWLGGSVDGGMTAEIVVPERCLVAIPENVRLADACLAEPIAVALHGLRRAQFRAGDRVAVLGAGTVGLCAAAAAVDEGCEVTVVARHPQQRDLASRLGARVADTATGQDIVVAAAGGHEGVARASEMARPGGTLLVLTVPRAPFVPAGAFFRELTVVTSMAYAGSPRRDIDDAITLLARTPVLAELITHRFALEDAEKAFAVAGDRTAGAIKVVLQTTTG